MRVDADLLWDLLEELNSFGATGEGVERLAWTEPEIAARDRLLHRCRDEGLDAGYDEAGNVWAFAGRRPAVMLGSHLDTVPSAGRFDGALGIAAALAVVTQARSRGLPGAERLGLLCFTDEEGVRFGLGMAGSRAVAGDLAPDDVRRARTHEGTSLAEVMRARGLDPDRVADAALRRRDIDCYLELHVEQGRRLERRDLPAGIVTGIVGLSHWRIDVHGEANHAGTTLPEDRHDALIPVAAAVLQAQRTMRARDGLVATVGEAEVVGGATNIVPGRARFSLDVRSLDQDAIATAVQEVVAAARSAAEDTGCEIRIDETKRLHPAAMTERVRTAMRSAADELKVDVTELESLAGHDAMTLTRAGIDCGMIFVRSLGGISHSPKEYSAPEDCATAASLLGTAALRLAASTAE